MKKQAQDFKFEVPELPDELKKVTSPRDKAYLDYIKLLQQKLKQDFMTGLSHKEQFEGHDKGSGAFIYIDGDGLKKLNDTLGHEAGSAAIMALAQGIKNALRGGDNVEIARMGGDEFAVHIQGASLSTGVAIAKRILESINNQKLGSFYKGKDSKAKEILSELTMKASLGVGRTKEEADKALYTAKQKGRNRVEFYKNSDKAASNDRLKVLVASLIQAGNHQAANKLSKLIEE
jgi:diguanylate cyclase (GGDEF)-like protein